MMLWQRILALLAALCLVGGGAALAQDAPYALIDPIETSAEAQIVVRFRGEAGVTYALHHNYQGVWLQPAEVTLLSAEGQFRVVLGLGRNEFVLNEKGQPRNAQGAVPFAIELLDPSKATQAPAPAAQGGVGAEASQSPTASQAPAAQPEAPAKAAGSASPTAAQTLKPTQTPKPVQAAEPTRVPEPTQAPGAVLAPAAAAGAVPEPAQSPEAAAPSEPETVDAAPELGGDRVLRLWARGNDVEALQAQLSALGFKTGRADGVYGQRTRAAVRRFQRKHDLKIDGVVGEKTRAKLAELGVTLPPYVAPDLSMPEGFSRELSFGATGMDVHRVQERLIALQYLDEKADQVYGKRTRKAVLAFQLENGLKADGICGPETLRALFP